ncbi:hypothetical protein T10_10861 [Trichinella papuae]|uniref:Uncharacterized protein n=1 Tax=Trichinella papuae TaxID=268474 RepID=A0A0V1MYF3_9BILA|nr:hypothetical protein T10_10861 [Trichinella papuae]
MECLNEVAEVDKHDAEFICLQLVSTSLNHTDQDFGIHLAPSKIFYTMPTFSRASSHLAHVRRRYSSRAGTVGYHLRCAFWPHASLAEADRLVSLAFINNACRFVGLSMGSAVKAAFPSLMRR